MTQENDMWEEGTVVQKEFPDGTVYGKIAIHTHSKRIEGGYEETRDPPRVYILDMTNVPNDMRKEYWKRVDPDDGWAAVPEKHYMWVREKVMDIIEKETGIVDVECNNRGGEDCHPTSFAIDERDNAFQLIYEALRLHMNKYDKPSNWPAEGDSDA